MSIDDIHKARANLEELPIHRYLPMPSQHITFFSEKNYKSSFNSVLQSCRLHLLCCPCSVFNFKAVIWIVVNVLEIFVPVLRDWITNHATYTCQHLCVAVDWDAAGESSRFSVFMNNEVVYPAFRWTAPAFDGRFPMHHQSELASACICSISQLQGNLP